MPISTSKPSDAASTIRWATDGGTRVAPSSGHMDTGWEFEEPPPATTMNWLQGVAGDWIAYADAALDELDSTKLDTADGGTVSGPVIFDSGAPVDFNDTTTFIGVATSYKSGTGYTAGAGPFQVKNFSNTVHATPASAAHAQLSFICGVTQPDGFDIDVYRNAEDDPRMRLMSVVDAVGAAVMTLAASSVTMHQAASVEGNLELTTSANGAPSALGYPLRLRNTSATRTVSGGYTGVSVTLGATNDDGFDFGFYSSADNTPIMTVSRVVSGVVTSMLTSAAAKFTFQDDLSVVTQKALNVTKIVFNNDMSGEDMNTAYTNTLVSRTIPKATGIVFASGAGTYGATDGFNLEGSPGLECQLGVDNFQLKVNFEVNITDPIVVATANNGGNISITISALSGSTDHFRIRAWDVDAGTAVNFTNTQCTIHFVVYGTQ